MRPSEVEEFVLLVVGELRDLRLDRGRDHDAAGALGPRHRLDPGRKRVAGRGRGLVDIGDVEHRLGGEEVEGRGTPFPRPPGSPPSAPACPALSSASAASISATSALASLSPVWARLRSGDTRRSRLARSASISSVLTVSASDTRVDAALDVGDVAAPRSSGARARSRRPRGCWRGTGCPALRPSRRRAPARRCRRS